MTDYDIKVKGECEITLYGTDDDTIVVPSTVKFDTDRRKADIEIAGLEKVKIGIPADIAEKIEIEMGDSSLSVSGLRFEQLEIDSKGSIVVDVEDVEGSIEINMVGGEAVLRVPEGFGFKAENRGRNTVLENELVSSESAGNRVELNGKDSVLKIVSK
ncbi:hypothetical protein SAMN02910456_01342 [Ruminococcaceae bacterium YRB3002]|nr:hypothetical protein SAMN02910456_01342 [Ruminococcaceae bacterium YRB3002]